MIRYVKVHLLDTPDPKTFLLVETASIKLMRTYPHTSGFQYVELVLAFGNDEDDGKAVGIHYESDIQRLALALHEPNLFAGMKFRKLPWEKDNEC